MELKDWRGWKRRALEKRGWDGERGKREGSGGK